MTKQTIRLVNMHLPPRGTDNVFASQSEGFRIVSNMLHKPGLAQGDANSIVGQSGPSPEIILKRCEGSKSHGKRIDSAVSWGLVVEDFAYLSDVNGVPMLSDHPHCTRTVFHLPGSNRHYVVFAYNLATLATRRDMGQKNPEARVAEELRAMNNSLDKRRFRAVRPLGILLQEAIGHDLPDLPGMRLIRDRSNLSRANLAAYVPRRAFESATWRQGQETWSRTQHTGEHQARAYLGIDVKVKV